MPYLPHAVKSSVGAQPGVITAAVTLDRGVGQPTGGRWRVLVDVELLGSPSSRSIYKQLMFVGSISVRNSSSSTPYERTIAGGAYDTLITFLQDTAGGGLTLTAARLEVIKDLVGRSVTVQALGGRLVAL
jgi:hypothetical protein